MDALTHKHDSSFSVKEKNLKTTKHNTEPDTVCKSNKGEIEVKHLPGSTQNADSGLAELHEKNGCTETYT